MLCKHCYADIGFLGQKFHVCSAKNYMERPSKQARKNEEIVRKRPVVLKGGRDGK